MSEDQNTVNSAATAQEPAEKPVEADAATGAAATAGQPDSEPEPATDPKPVADSDHAPEPEPDSDPEPAVPPVTKQRQWVTLRGTSMDLRVGWGTRADFAHDLRSALGKPHGCALIHDAAAPAELIDFLRQDLMAEGFTVSVGQIPAGCDLAAVEELDEFFAVSHITSDDIVVAVGDARALSVASFACTSWCGGVNITEVPLDLASAVTAAATPCALDLGGRPRMVEQDGNARFCFVDLELLDLDPSSENVRLARAHMVATAMDDSDKALGRLWDNAPALLAGDRQVMAEQLVDTVRSRGKVVSSSALAIRQSIEYGQSFAYALATLLGPEVPFSTLLTEGLRFASRLAVALDVFKIDDMFTQDELLDRLELGSIEADVDPDALVAAIRDERLCRTRRFMLSVPRAIGRVRLSVVDEPLLREHIGAWADSVRH